MDAIESIEDSLDQLEEVLGPLLEHPLHETISQLEVIQKAKLQVVIPYVINDLIFIYLRTRGVNPKTHPVIGELDRVKDYFGKIKNAEDPEKRKLVVDQQAAARFLKHALTESQATIKKNSPNTEGVHTRFTEPTTQGNTSVPSAAALAKIQARAIRTEEKLDSSEDEDDLKVFGETEQESSTLELEKQVEPVDIGTTTKRRRTMDPWTGYDEEKATATPDVKSHTEVEQLQETSKRQTTSTGEVANVSTSTDFTELDENSTPGPSQSKKSRKNQQKIVETRSMTGTPKTGQQLSSVIDGDALDSSPVTKPTRARSQRKKRKKQ